jgi:hypothetical protein
MITSKDFGKRLRDMTVDTATTIGGFALAAAVGGASTFLAGGVTKEAVIAGAIVAGGGWFINRGNTSKAIK